MHGFFPLPLNLVFTLNSFNSRENVALNFIISLFGETNLTYGRDLSLSRLEFLSYAVLSPWGVPGTRIVATFMTLSYLHQNNP